MEKWIRANFQPCLPLGDNNSKITGSEKHIQLSRTAAAEGTVLLKNDNRLLPLQSGTKVAIFGKAQIDYVKGGGGSGDTTVAYVRNIYQGLKLKEPQVEVFDALSLYYQDYVTKTYKEEVKPGMSEEPSIPVSLIMQAKKFTDTAIITICRYSQEGYDRKNDDSDSYFHLSVEEKNMVKLVTENFSNVIVLLNVGAMFDTSWFADNDKISSAVMLWQGGMEGGLVAADVLVGDANPSGKLVDTFAKSFDDYPSSEGFHESEDYVKYTEDIYVGYRYFETIPDKQSLVVYPFGYGLSYTTFELSQINAFRDSKYIFVTVTVKNTGHCSGKEVVQVYYSAPQGKLGKPAKELCGFQKTKSLAPGESEDLCIRFAINDMASFDDKGLIAKSSFVLEKGTYKIYVGNSVRNLTKLDFAYETENDIITKKSHSYCSPVNLEKRLTANGEFEEMPKNVTEKTSFSCKYQIVQKPDVEKPYTLLDVAEGITDLDTFIAQLTDEELCHLVGGQPNTGVVNTGGMGNLKRLEIPNVVTADGPAGLKIRQNRGVTTTAFPVATNLACSWNIELLEEIGKEGALEVKENNISIWLTPAMNIHRNPLCGRNFEYYSEDPFISGKMAAALVRGIQSQNIVATPKHFACNNKETNRHFSDSIVSERALREIYLKGFEICVKEAKPKMIMTSYNFINGVPASECQELLIGILRNEWGYEGMLTTDWWNEKSHVKEVQAGNDIKMAIGEPEKLMVALKSGELKREELAICVKRILEMILWLE